MFHLDLFVYIHIFAAYDSFLIITYSLYGNNKGSNHVISQVAYCIKKYSMEY